jgi:hypothetical protein
MQISAQLRYTMDECWLVAKGDLFKGRAGTGVGGAAVPPLAAMIANAWEFCGADSTTRRATHERIARRLAELAGTQVAPAQRRAVPSVIRIPSFTRRA